MCTVQLGEIVRSSKMRMNDGNRGSCAGARVTDAWWELIKSSLNDFSRDTVELHARGDEAAGDESERREHVRGEGWCKFTVAARYENARTFFLHSVALFLSELNCPLVGETMCIRLRAQQVTVSSNDKSCRLNNKFAGDSSFRRIMYEICLICSFILIDLFYGGNMKRKICSE